MHKTKHLLPPVTTRELIDITLDIPVQIYETIPYAPALAVSKKDRTTRE